MISQMHQANVLVAANAHAAQDAPYLRVLELAREQARRERRERRHVLR